MPASDYAPSIAEVAARIRNRTRTHGGGEVGTFNTNTIPTATEVQPVIDQALIDVAMEIGTEVPDTEDEHANPRLSAKSLVSLYAAAQIELTFWSEQVATGESIYAQLMAQYEAKLPRVKKMIDKARSASGDSSADMGESAALPVSLTPKNAGGLIGYDTRF